MGSELAHLVTSAFTILGICTLLFWAIRLGHENKRLSTINHERVGHIQNTVQTTQRDISDLASKTKSISDNTSAMATIMYNIDKNEESTKLQLAQIQEKLK